MRFDTTSFELTMDESALVLSWLGSYNDSRHCGTSFVSHNVFMLRKPVRTFICNRRTTVVDYFAIPTIVVNTTLMFRRLSSDKLKT